MVDQERVDRVLDRITDDLDELHRLHRSGRAFTDPTALAAPISPTS
jgi:hypothetical protein